MDGRFQDDINDAKSSYYSVYRGFVIWLIVTVVCSIVAIACWLHTMQTMYQGTVVANHYSWNTEDDYYAIHYYCTVKYNNGSICERSIAVDRDSSELTVEKVEERTQAYCAMNSTKSVYEDYYTEKCELQYNENSYVVSVIFFIFTIGSGIVMFTYCYLSCERYKIIRQLEQNSHQELFRPQYQIVPIHSSKISLQKPIITNINVCNICFDSMQNTVITIFPCGHNYHKKCIDKWFETNNTCPECRKNISEGGEAINASCGDCV